MTKRMLIDATHAEETRVAVVDGNRLMEFDYESQVRRQIKGSIYLAKVTRVEPSLQASFVNFGGNRHGFLPFAEIHPDYYRIPIADREALLAEQKAEMEAYMAEERAAEEEEERAAAGMGEGVGEESETEEEEDIVEELGGEKPPADESDEDDEDPGVEEDSGLSESSEAAGEDVTVLEEEPNLDFSPIEEDEGDELHMEETLDEALEGEATGAGDAENFDESGESDEDADDVSGNVADAVSEEGQPAGENAEGGEGRRRGRYRGRGGNGGGRHHRGRGGRGRHAASSSRQVEVLGGDGVDGDRPVRPTSRRHYKIQEVIKRGQIMLVQASKEERGNKGAAMTTYLSLPGRYCVLMPNSPRGGGVSRKIANFAERKRMREILSELNVPEGMSVIMRTAGMSRTKVEIKRDLDYLLRLWDEIRELTLKSSAPALIHEEGKLIRRAVRDLYSRDIEEIVVSGDDGFKAARDFMKVMMPSHIKRVIQYKDDQMPLFQRYQVESQIREMGEPTVTLKSGGYLVINPTEALVSVDVNSGRATRERHIEETALKTNLEAAEEVARQLRLRDLGGLVVIDFIDMEDRRNNAKVERKLRDALSTDRARIQMGRISSFGLMELSRQRLNPSLTEAQFEKCKHCQGIGHVRTVDNAAILALRALEEEGMRARAAAVQLTVCNDVAIYILNNKREMLADIERRYDFKVMVRIEDPLVLSPAIYKIDLVRIESEDEGEEEQESRSESREGVREGGRDGGRRGRGRRGGRDRYRSEEESVEADEESSASESAAPESEAPDENGDAAESVADEGDSGQQHGGEERRERNGGRRRGRRGGRGRNREGRPQQDGDSVAAEERQPESGPEQESGSRSRHHHRAEQEQAPVPQPSAVAASPARSEPVFYGRRTRSSDSASNDAGQQAQQESAEAKAYEVVNEQPGQKKKGWWNRIVE
ncbi:MAG: Rne/Rng family ribonuclease [Micavibrio aeruginosavorus]|nr:Rne/Rng family ribonuclease [Micavibrio aeruginosavorus]